MLKLVVSLIKNILNAVSSVALKSTNTVSFEYMDKLFGYSSNVGAKASI